VDIICHTAGLKNFQTTPESQKKMDDMVLAADVKFALFKTRPDVEVLAKDGSVLVKARENGSADEEIIDEINDIVKKSQELKRPMCVSLPAHNNNNMIDGWRSLFK